MRPFLSLVISSFGIPKSILFKVSQGRFKPRALFNKTCGSLSLKYWLLKFKELSSWLIFKNAICEPIGEVSSKVVSLFSRINS